MEVSVHGDHVTDSDLGFGFFFCEAGVDEIVFKFGSSSSFGGAEHVLGLGAEHEESVAGAGLGVNDDTLGGHHSGIESAEGVDAEESVVVDVLDDEANFIHVCGEHELLAIAGAFLNADYVTKGIGFDFIADLFEFTENDAADDIFLARDPGGFGQFFQELDVHVPVLPLGVAQAAFLRSSYFVTRFRPASFDA